MGKKSSSFRKSRKMPSGQLVKFNAAPLSIFTPRQWEEHPLYQLIRDPVVLLHPWIAIYEIAENIRQFLANRTNPRRNRRIRMIESFPLENWFNHSDAEDNDDFIFRGKDSPYEDPWDDDDRDVLN